MINYFRYLYKLSRENGCRRVRDATRKLVKSMSPNSLRHLAQLVAAPHRLAPWPGWKTDAVINNNPLVVLRQEIVTFVRNNQLNFFINYQFQPGIIVKIRLTESVGRNLFVSGCKEPNEFVYLKKILKPGMVFLDIGANIGLHTMFAARCVGAKGLVIAMEPSKREFIRLEENAKRNRFKNVRLLNTGASNSQRTAELHISDESEPGQNTLGGFMYPEVKEVRRENVALDKVDNVLFDLKVKHIDVVKIDIEGHELFALDGMSSALERDHPVVFMEIEEVALQKQGCTPLQIFLLLQRLNYEMMIFKESTGLPAPISDWESRYGNSIVCLPSINFRL